MALLTDTPKPYPYNRKFLMSVGLSIALLIFSLIVNFYAGIYATEKASSPVTDIILSNTRVFDVDGIFIYGPILFWIFVGALCIIKPRKIPFTAKNIALFVFIRSIFITLTHIGPYPTHLVISPNIIDRFTFGGDLFFSGHTGAPFLMALVFWDDIRLRFTFIATAIFFGVIVLLAHLHYSIDVLSAFFITYAIYRIAEIVFREDKKVFQSG